MKISIFGLGYVGVVSAACLASKGHQVTGVDVNHEKVKMLKEGQSPIIENGLSELLAEGLDSKRITAICNPAEAVQSTDVSMVCVGTPSRANGSLDTKYIENVSAEIGQALRDKNKEHIIIFRSTMLPSTMREVVIPKIEEASYKKQNKDFYVAYNPEFLRESTAIYDFFNPPKIVVGADTEEISDIVLSIYEGLPGPRIKTEIEIAEMVKYVDNNFHALKITFANEIGHLCKSIGIDSHKVMDIFVQDKKLNISPAYLKPGFAFGGSCLPKDLRAINYLAKMHDIETPLLNSIIPSNNMQILKAIKKIMQFGKKKIGIAGISFKEGTDDLRESPIIEIIETLIGKGYDLKLYDQNISLAKLIGANKEYINNHIPHIAVLMVDTIDELIAHGDLIVIGNNDKSFARILAAKEDEQLVFDLVRVMGVEYGKANYHGICW
jgi:GDP-mannose 6-dehydrogenase